MPNDIPAQMLAGLDKAEVTHVRREKGGELKVAQQIVKALNFMIRV